MLIIAYPVVFARVLEIERDGTQIMPTITLENVSKYYKNSHARRSGRRYETGVENVDLKIKQGEFVFITGSSGAGKSTMLDLISGQIKPDRGRVLVDGVSMAHLVPWRRERVALLFGRVAQEHTLIRKMTVGDNLMMAARVGRKHFESTHEMRGRIKKVMGLVGLSGMEGRYPVEMSLGECRCIELARAMINSPPILVLDEITANLDDDSIWDMFHLLTEINRRGTTVIMSTHASQYVNIMRRRVVTVVDGHILGDVPKGRYGDVV